MKIMDFVETNSNISYKDMQPISFYKNYIPTKDNVAFLNILQRYEKLEKNKSICAFRENFCIERIKRKPIEFRYLFIGN